MNNIETLPPNPQIDFRTQGNSYSLDIVAFFGILRGLSNSSSLSPTFKLSLEALPISADASSSAG